MIHPDPDRLQALALEHLPDGEAAALAEHLEHCEGCRRSMREALETLAGLTLSGPPAPVPPAWEGELLARVGAGKPAPRPPSRAFLGLGAALALALALAVGLERGAQPSTPERLVLSLAAQPGASTRPLVNLEGRSGGLVVSLPSGGLVIYLKSPPPRGRVYQAWRVTEAGRVSLGLCTTQVLEVDEPIPPGTRIGVSVEPPGGSPQPTTPSVGRAML